METVTTRHRLTGKVDKNTPAHIARHPVLGAQLDIVAPDAKPYIPEMHRPKVETEASDLKVEADKPLPQAPSNKNSKD